MCCVRCAVQSQGADGKVTSLHMTLDDEKQLLSEKPALRQIYEAQVCKSFFCSCLDSICQLHIHVKDTMSVCMGSLHRLKATVELTMAAKPLAASAYRPTLVVVFPACQSGTLVATRANA